VSAIIANYSYRDFAGTAIESALWKGGDRRPITADYDRYEDRSEAMTTA
jgi:hypothetical protein